MGFRRNDTRLELCRAGAAARMVQLTRDGKLFWINALHVVDVQGSLRGGSVLGLSTHPGAERVVDEAPDVVVRKLDAALLR